MKNMDKIIKLGKPEITIIVNSSIRAKNYSIRILNSDNSVKLTIPSNGSFHEALAFIRLRETWIREKLSNRLPDISPKYGGEILFKGQKLIINMSNDKKTYIDNDKLYLDVKTDQLSGKLKAFLKNKARDRLAFVSNDYSNIIGRTFKKLTLRDTKTRWGSCSSNGNLMYSWRLIMAPPKVLNYVAAHEVSHLLHLNHSTNFWDTVSYLMPDFRDHKDWLRKNGQLLHRYKF